MPGAVSCREPSATVMMVAMIKTLVRAVIIVVQSKFRRNKAEADEPAGRPLYELDSNKGTKAVVAEMKKMGKILVILKRTNARKPGG